MADTPKSRRGKATKGQFEVVESEPSDQTREERKRSRVESAQSEEFTVATQKPSLVLRVYLAGTLPEVDPVALAADISGLVQAFSETERDLGGGGLVLADQRAEPEVVVLTLRYALPEGAARRAGKLAMLLNRAFAQADSAASTDLLALLGEAVSSPVARVKLLLAAGARTISRCEVRSIAA